MYPLPAPPEVPQPREHSDGPLTTAVGQDKTSAAEFARLGATRIAFGPRMQHHAAGATGELAVGLRG